MGVRHLQAGLRMGQTGDKATFFSSVAADFALRLGPNNERSG
jgi:hypothetical protein